jgi:UDP:flavonoid glycosyltransferase YjiC (YdhE family)
VTLGSSGDPLALGPILEALAGCDCEAIVATAASQPLTSPVASNLHFVKFIDGNSVAERAALVICNGGSPACQQAFAHGVPVLGLPSNLDQYLHMHYVERYGAGRQLRADRATAESVSLAVRQLLDDPRYRQRAATLRTASARHHAPATLAATVDGLVR